MTTEQRTEYLAQALHKFYRAALIAIPRVSKSRTHDHGWSLCNKESQNYFRKRAALMIKRANLELPENSAIIQLEEKLEAKLVTTGLLK